MRRRATASQGQITDLIAESMTEVVVTLARSTLRATDLLNLQVGDIVSTEKDIREPLDVEVQGVVKFHAKAGALKGRKAIELIGVSESSKPKAAAPAAG
jgi:flagellar motor switch protein FliM